MISTFLIFGRPVTMLTVFTIVGLLVSGSIALFFTKKRGLSVADTFYMIIYTLIGCFLGAKIFYFIFSIDVYWVKDLTVLENISRLCGFVLNGGLVFYGGLIGALSGAVIYLKQYHMPVFQYLSTILPVIPLFHMFGRIGCFFTGCCHGFQYNGPLHVTYRNSIVTINHVGYFPVQIIEAFFNLFLFFLLTYLLFKKPNWNNGKSFGLYLLFYSIMRFILEFLRGDEIRGHIFMLSSSQWISLLLFPLAIYLLTASRFNISTLKKE